MTQMWRRSSHVGPTNSGSTREPPRRSLTRRIFNWVNSDPAEKVPTFKSCLDRNFVQLEVRAAKQVSKPIIAVFEEDPRRQAFFDYGEAWSKYGNSEWEWVLNIDAVTYRRDTEEAEAMLKRIDKKLKGPFLSSRPVDPVPDALNKPGHWDIFLSHAQAAAGDQVRALFFLLVKRGYKVWYDYEMSNRNTDAMREGVLGSTNFLLFLSGDPKLC